MRNRLIVTALLSLSIFSTATRAESLNRNSEFKWAKSKGGDGLCYEYTKSGAVLHEGAPVLPANCRRLAPTRFEWMLANNRKTYCFELSPSGIGLNRRNPVHQSNCKKTNPTHYDWDLARNGQTYCYEMTSSKRAINEESPVSDEYCKRPEIRPQFLGWALGTKGYAVCAEFSSDAKQLPTTTDPDFCRNIAPTYNSWEYGIDGILRCYEMTTEKWAVSHKQDSDCDGVDRP